MLMIFRCWRRALIDAAWCRYKIRLLCRSILMRALSLCARWESTVISILRRYCWCWFYVYVYTLFCLILMLFIFLSHAAPLRVYARAVDFDALTYRRLYVALMRRFKSLQDAFCFSRLMLPAMPLFRYAIMRFRYACLSSCCSAVDTLICHALLTRADIFAYACYTRLRCHAAFSCLFRAIMLGYFHMSSIMFAADILFDIAFIVSCRWCCWYGAYSLTLDADCAQAYHTRHLCLLMLRHAASITLHAYSRLRLPWAPAYRRYIAIYHAPCARRCWYVHAAAYAHAWWRYCAILLECFAR